MRINLHSAYDNFPNVYGTSTKEINFYVDEYIYNVEDGDNNIALLVEPRSILHGVYKWVEENSQLFRYIFTFDAHLLRVLSNARLLIYGCISAEYPDMPKTKNISMVCSNKMMCQGHVDRINVATALLDVIDTYGRFNGGNFCDSRDIYADYRFNVAMENFSGGHYFTEKICNCFASKVVPIYYGCPHILEYFYGDGIIIAESPEDVIREVKRVLRNPEEEYNKRKEAIEENFKLVQKYKRYDTLFLKTYSDLLENM